MRHLHGSPVAFGQRHGQRLDARVDEVADDTLDLIDSTAPYGLTGAVFAAPGLAFAQAQPNQQVTQTVTKIVVSGKKGSAC